LAIELASSRTIIGRDEGDIMTMDPETSKRHAMIEIMNDGTVWITDLGSTNGTIIDGLPIASTAQLHDRQEFTCGKSAFMIMIDKD
jgi:pSer/pThr/pTyr-binding forkhead associated (FHA) protein